MKIKKSTVVATGSNRSRRSPKIVKRLRFGEVVRPKIGKTYTYKGKKVSVLSARCTDGKLQAFASSIFADGTKASAGIVPPAVPRADEPEARGVSRAVRVAYPPGPPLRMQIRPASAVGI